ncbi:Aquaporin NIP1-1 [Zostera marina]|uniref:Aquaporin NIP1-1 n=1 Tax=Zostera marina TaxID=29655 RepID=A0A0K9P1U0_ZOSMR|nr:Aquaporin NIP1-1 [Zostera marina]
MTGGDEERRSVNHVDNDHRVEISVEDKVAVGEKVACGCGVSLSVSFSQKIIAEFIGTYFLIFAGCASVILNLMKGTVTLPGISIVWGLVVMVMIFSVGHISGAHFNPAVTIAFATVGRFPWQQVPAYISAQVFASILASGTLRLIFGGSRELFAGTTPDGSDIQSFVLEFIATFYLMFVISSVGTDIRAFGKFAGIAIGGTVSINVIIAGPISGAALNPARTLGPAIVAKNYKSIWVYMIGPIFGAIAGAWAYNLLRFTNKHINEIVANLSIVSICKK